VKKSNIIRTIILFSIGFFLAYHSVYFKKFSEVKGAITSKFDAAEFAQKLWEEQMPAKMDSAMDLTELMLAVSIQPDKAFEEYTHALAIGNYRYAMVKFSGLVKEVSEDECLVEIRVADSILTVKLATEFIFGNAIRDASGLVSVKDFPNTDDLNGISEWLNKLVRTKVIPPFKQAVKGGDTVSITAALEINKEHIHWQGSEIIPVRLQIIN